MVKKKNNLTMKQFNNEFNSGFTLIELLVVIFIIGALTGIILPNFVGSRQRARDARRKQDLADIKNALRMYYNDNQAYPATLNTADLDDNYISAIPQDPTGGDYGYCVSDDSDRFVLCADLENEGDSDNLLLADSNCNNICPAGSECVCGDTKCYYICAN